MDVRFTEKLSRKLTLLTTHININSSSLHYQGPPNYRRSLSKKYSQLKNMSEWQLLNFINLFYSCTYSNQLWVSIFKNTFHHLPYNQAQGHQVNEYFYLSSFKYTFESTCTLSTLLILAVVLVLILKYHVEYLYLRTWVLMQGKFLALKDVDWRWFEVKFYAELAS